MALQIPKKDPSSLAVLSGLIDLTSLEGTDSDTNMRLLCRKAITAKGRFPFLHPISSVCVFPVFVKAAKQELEGTGIRVATVSGGFPHGQSAIKIKLEETRKALEDGADEIDFVFSRGRFLAGDIVFVQEEIAAIRECCGNRILKIILETGELDTIQNIESASRIALDAGADFIKTSTGKSKKGASPEAVECMAKVIRTYYEKTKTKKGIKISGGISDIKTSMQYLSIIEPLLGKEWINSKTLRFGASQLFDNILEALYH